MVFSQVSLTIERAAESTFGFRILLYNGTTHVQLHACVLEFINTGFFNTDVSFA